MSAVDFVNWFHPEEGKGGGGQKEKVNEETSSYGIDACSVAKSNAKVMSRRIQRLIAID